MEDTSSPEVALAGAMATRTFDAPEVHIGQARDATLLDNPNLRRDGGDLVGAAPEVSEDVVRQAAELAAALGDAWQACPEDAERWPSDARRRELRAEIDAQAEVARAAAKEAAERHAAAEEEADKLAAPSTWLVAPAALASTLAGLAGGVLLYPSVQLVLGAIVVNELGPQVARGVTFGTALMVACVAPVVAVVGAVMRASTSKLVGAAVFEVACIGTFAFARARLLGEVPGGVVLTPDEIEAIHNAGVWRSAMLFSVETLLVVAVTGLGLAMARMLAARDEWDKAARRVARLEARGLTLAEAATRLAERQTADLAAMVERDVAVARGPKVARITQALVLQGARVQAQANFDLLQDAPRAQGYRSLDPVVPVPAPGSSEN